MGHAEIAREEADAVLEDEGSGEPELEAVEEGEEQEVREVAALVEQPRTLSQSLGNKFKWFLIRLVFKVIFLVFLNLLLNLQSYFPSRCWCTH